jgi:tetratricopeptide (TPR) repeat protein
MNCPAHPDKAVIGYCSVCGTFGCDECLTLHEGGFLCSRHYRHIAEKLEEEKKFAQSRKRPTRQRLVVRYANGRIDYGVCLALNPKERGFHLERVSQDGMTTGETVYVGFADLKAVFYVKSFDGKYDRSLRYREWKPEGAELVVEFNDGEKVRGFAVHRYDPAEPRFYLIPADPRSNNISILVEGAAIAGVYTIEEYQAKRAEEKKTQEKSETVPDLGQEETLGDFYFQTRNYPAALDQYRLAVKKFPHSHRLRKKIVFTQYNVGVQYIKQHEYPKALECMEAILKSDPRNPHAIKKAAQLHRIIEKGASPVAQETGGQAEEGSPAGPVGVQR